MNVAIIPARGGSKRIPRKNIRDFCGKPMIAWSIEAALQSGLFEHVVVSTDDDEIARLAIAHGAQAPFRRPAHLADDVAATRPVVNHAIGEVTRLYGEPEYVCCLYATAPFVEAADLLAAYTMLLDSAAQFVFPVATYAYPVQRALRLGPDGFTRMLYPEHAVTRSQDLEEVYHDAGQFYWGRREAFLSNVSAFNARSLPYVLPRHRVQDIDTHEDWQRAELMFRLLHQSG
ncbi:MAG: CMP-N,N'-diacetyllegionaminic acid synthase [Pseudomonas citronellolis]|nr:MAG: CMP-N,N'-diacetyllegionaminic acid synthase [Pseudomonas citronellolis]